MGFLKKFFSLGSKKSRRKQQAERVDANGRIVQEQTDGEATRLLRSASAHYAVASEIDYSLLPPLPRPINNVAPTSVPSPAQSSVSIQRRGTYTVKLLERKVESCTEFPNANPCLRDQQLQFDETPTRSRIISHEVPFTPRDRSRLLRLRQDPSVASLLNMYDENGRISSTAFSNSPPTPATIPDAGGREQVKRSGSTLRQLLGDKNDPQKDYAESDISWAERFLGEHADSPTSPSSLASTNPVQTPKDIRFTNVPSAKPTISHIRQFSQESTNHPAISSMEVELSNATAAHIDPTHAPDSASRNPEQKTPMRAAEVFGFVTERRKSILERQRSRSDRLPALTRSPSETQASHPSRIPPPSYPKARGPDTSDSSDTLSAHIHTATVTKLKPMTNPLSRSVDNLLQYSQHAGSSSTPQLLARVHTTGDSQSSVPALAPSKIPRGPRPLSISAQIPPSANKPQHPIAREIPGRSKTGVQDTLANCEPSVRHTRVLKQAHVSTTPSHASQQRRLASHTSSIANIGNDDASQRKSAPKKTRKSERAQRDKENSPPTTLPLRTIFDMRHPNLTNGEPPSPASSSELSPYTKDMMMNLRKQRMRARDGMRSSSASRSRRSP